MANPLAMNQNDLTPERLDCGCLKETALVESRLGFDTAQMKGHGSMSEAEGYRVAKVLRMMADGGDYMLKLLDLI
jgi:hypothetical protein